MDEESQAQDQGQTQEQASADQADASTQDQVPTQFASGQVPAQFVNGGNVAEVRLEQVGERLMTVVTQQVEQVLERLREEGVTLSPAKWAQAMNAFTGWCLSVEARLSALEAAKKGQGQTQG